MTRFSLGKVSTCIKNMKNPGKTLFFGSLASKIAQFVDQGPNVNFVKNWHIFLPNDSVFYGYG